MMIELRQFESNSCNPQLAYNFTFLLDNSVV